MLGAIKTRLEAIASSPFKAIEGASRLAELEHALPPRTRLPIACVYPLAASAGENQFATGLVSQTITARIGVAILAAAQAERQGEGVVVEMEALYQAVRQQLVGWAPADTDDEDYLEPMLFAGGAMSGMKDGLVLWVEQYTIKQLLRSPI